MTTLRTVAVAKNLAWLFTLSLSIIAPLGVANQVQAANKERCIVIQQMDAKVGKMTLYIGPNHARIDCMNDHCTIVAAAPKWNVTVFNKDKYAAYFKSAQWQARGLENVVASKRHIFNDYKHTKIKYLGKSAIKVVRQLDPTYSDGSETIYRAKIAKGKGITASSTYIGSSDFAFAPGAASFVEGFYLSPSYARVILKAYTPSVSGESIQLDTKSISTKDLDDSFFAVPPGLKKAHSITAVIAGEDINGLLLDITEDH